MRQRIIILTLFASGMMAFTCVARAGDADDVKAEYLRHIANVNAGNIDAFIAQHLPEHTAFGPFGDMLGTWDSPEAEKAGRPDLAKPANPQVRAHNVEARVYGNAAVVTAYLRTTVLSADGTARPGVRRVTAVWVKQNGKWLEVHDHMSTLVTTPPQ